MKPIPSVELNKAIYSAISPIYPVHSVKKSNPKFPFVEIGLETETDENTKTDSRTMHNLTIHTFEKSNSALPIKTLNQTVKDQVMSLDNVQGFSVDFVRFVSMFTMTETDADSTVWHGVLQFEVVLTAIEDNESQAI